MGALRYVADRPHAEPASICVSIDAGRWHVSFATEDAALDPSPDEIRAELSAWTEADLMRSAIGIDRGVAVPAYASTGEIHDFDPVQKCRMAKKARRRLRWQRRMARRTRGLSGWRKARRQVARSYTYANNVRRDFAHQASHRLVGTPGIHLLVMEDLKVQAMTRRPKGKQDQAGRWMRNGARAKSGSIRPCCTAHGGGYAPMRSTRPPRTMSCSWLFRRTTVRRNVPHAATFTPTTGSAKAGLSADAASTPTTRTIMPAGSSPGVASSP